MSMTHVTLRHYSRSAALGVMLLVATSTDGVAQSVHGKGNAHVMDLSLQFDSDGNKVACLGEPNVLNVNAGDVVVFRARGTFVNNVSWDPDSAAANSGNPPLAVPPNSLNTGPFARGRAFAITINPGLQPPVEGITYELKVTCGNVKDAPPKIIVDP